MDIFLTLALRNSANPNDAADNTIAVSNIKLYALAVGNDAACPVIITILDWFVCMYIPARAGPIAPPRILIRLFVPSDIPACVLHRSG
jgi:hypothetical protein